MTARFVYTHLFREERFSLGRDGTTGDYFLSIPVANRMVDYEEFYRLTGDQHRRFVSDEGGARLCRRLPRAAARRRLDPATGQ